MHDEYLERGGAARFLWEAKRSRGKIRLTEGDLIPFASLPTPSLDESWACASRSHSSPPSSQQFEYTIREEGLFVHLSGLQENETKNKP